MRKFFLSGQFNKMYLSLSLIVALTIIGTIGFRAIEKFSFLDALYMTVITIATVGFGEVHPLSSEGKIFTIFLIAISFSTFAFALTFLSNYLISGEFNKYYKNFRMNKQIEKLSQHVVICGFGRNGRQAAAQLKLHGVPYVVIEKDQELITELKENDQLFIEGDATRDEIFFKANIPNARAIITSLPTDADNLFIVLTARTSNPGLTIISRASDDNSDKKLYAAGANNVIMPDKIGGAHMATLVVKPDIVEFMDYVTGQGGMPNNLVEITFDNLPERFRNKSIKDLEIRNKSGANIIGFKTAEGEFIINPTPETLMIPTAKLFVLGTEDQIQKMKNIFKN